MQQVNQCVRCGSENPVNHRFCGNCGAALAKKTQPVTKSDIPLGAKTRFHANNVLWDSDDKFFLLLYTLKPQILQAFAGGKSLLEIEAELGLPVGMIRTIMDRTKWTVTVFGKKKIMPLKKFTELVRKKGWQIGYGEHCFDENGLLSEESLIGMLSEWPLTSR